MEPFKSPCCDAKFNEIECSSCRGDGYQNEFDRDHDEVCGDCQGDGTLQGEYECLKCSEQFDESDLVAKE